MRGQAMAELETKLALENTEIVFSGPGFTRKVYSDPDTAQVFPNVPFINVAHTANLMTALYTIEDGEPVADSFQYEAAIGDVIRFSGQVITSEGPELPGSVDIALLIGNGAARVWGGRLDLPAGSIELDRATGSSGETLEFELTATIEEIPAEGSYVYVAMANTMSPSWPNDMGILDAKLLVQSEPEPEEPEPEEPEPSTEHHKALAERVASLLDREGDEETIALATHHVAIIESYVYGYTRGNGFSDTGEPNRQLSNVIVAVTAKLTYNPEQVTYYQAGDYSERPQYLTGWTLMEQAVLNNYRRRWA